MAWCIIQIYTYIICIYVILFKIYESLDLLFRKQVMGEIFVYIVCAPEINKKIHKYIKHPQFKKIKEKRRNVYATQKKMIVLHIYLFFLL